MTTVDVQVQGIEGHEFYAIVGNTLVCSWMVPVANGIRQCGEPRSAHGPRVVPVSAGDSLVLERQERPERGRFTYKVIDHPLWGRSDTPWLDTGFTAAGTPLEQALSEGWRVVGHIPAPKPECPTCGSGHPSIHNVDGTYTCPDPFHPPQEWNKPAVSVPEPELPSEPGWYGIVGTSLNLIFLLNGNRDWYAVAMSGDMTKCGPGYITQGMSEDRPLVRLVPVGSERDATIREWADYFEDWGSRVGDPEFTQARVVAALRGPQPFGRSGVVG